MGKSMLVLGLFFIVLFGTSSASADPCDPNPCQGILDGDGTCTAVGGGVCVPANDFTCGCDAGFIWEGSTNTCQYDCVEFFAEAIPDCGTAALDAAEILNTCVDGCVATGSCPLEPCFDNYTNAIADDCLDGGAFDPATCGACYQQCGLNFAECIAIPHPDWSSSICLEVTGLCNENCFLNPEVTCQDVIDKLYSPECDSIIIEAVENLKSCTTVCAQNESCIESCNDIYDAAITEVCYPQGVHPEHKGYVCGAFFLTCALDFFECIADPNETGLSCALANNACLQACPQNWVFPE